MEKAAELIKDHFQKQGWTILVEKFPTFFGVALSKEKDNRRSGFFFQLPTKPTASPETHIYGYLTLDGINWAINYYVEQKFMPQAPDVASKIIQSVEEIVEHMNMLAETPLDEIFARVTPERLLPKNLLEKIPPLLPNKLFFFSYRKTQTKKEAQLIFLEIQFSNDEGYRVTWNIRPDRIVCYFKWPHIQPVAVVWKARTYNQFESFTEQGNIIGVVANLPNCLHLLEKASPELASYCEDAAVAFSECWEIGW